MTDHELEQVAAAIDGAMAAAAPAGSRQGWEYVEWLRLKADLLDRLAAAGSGSRQTLARRGELIRDRAERLADELTGITQLGQPAADQPSADQPSAEVIQLWTDSSRAAT